MTALVGQREHGMRRKKAETELEYSFIFSGGSYNVPFHWFHLHRFASDMRPPFGAYSKIGAAPFSYLHVDLASVHSHCCLFGSGC